MKKQKKTRQTIVVVKGKSNMKTIKNVLKFFAFIFVGIAALLQMRTTPEFDGYERPDIIILDHANLLNKLIESETTLNELDTNDPINELITSKLRPIQEVYSSILKQTLIYEDMMKNSGQRPGSGPANFVESSTKQLEALHATLVLTLDLQLTEIWNTHIQRVNNDLKVWRETQQLFQRFRKDGGKTRFLEWQITTNITFLNIHNEQVPTNLSISKIQTMLHRLGTLLQQKFLKSAEVHKLTEEIKTGSHLSEKLNTAKQELDEVLMDLSEEREENGRYYKFTYHFLMKQHAKLIEIARKTQDPSNKFEFVNLRNQLQDDILLLMERLKKLLL